MRLQRDSGLRRLRPCCPSDLAVLSIIFAQRPQFIGRQNKQDNLTNSPFPFHYKISSYGALGRRGGFKTSGA